MEVILENSGVELLEDGDNYFLWFDAGELAVQMQKLKITAEEAEQVRKNLADAGIILNYQNKAILGVNSGRIWECFDEN
jgi:hypothetical protein